MAFCAKKKIGGYHEQQNDGLVKHIEGRLKELDRSLRGLEGLIDFPGLMEILYKHGWTTIAEITLVTGVIDSMIANVQGLTNLGNVLVRRIRKHKQDAATTLTPKSTFPVWLFQLPPDCVSAVILGFRMRASVREAVIKYLHDDDYKHVQLYQAWPHPTEYRLQLVPITLETISLPRQKLVIKNVPEAGVGHAVALCIGLPALTVERVRQPDRRLWTVVATAIVGRGPGKEGAEMDWSGAG